jgi:SAM-dependent methyltransferase
MHTTRGQVPWDYLEVVKQYMSRNKDVLDIGTGGGERFIRLASFFRYGLGVDIDPAMVEIAKQNAQRVHNIDFIVSDVHLTTISRQFDVIVDRHAPFDIAAIATHLKKGGFFITQQVGERNMLNVKQILRQTITASPLNKSTLGSAGLNVVTLQEYDVEYVVKDIESLVFWLNALDMLHADLKGSAALASADTLNAILAGNVDERGFVTNEHRYLAIVQYT